LNRAGSRLWLPSTEDQKRASYRNELSAAKADNVANAATCVL
jgi:hypothetical protein